MSNQSSLGQVSPSDIAELAGVSRAAVSNWRKRIADFPAKVSGTENNPLFDRAQVIEWLTARGHEISQPSIGSVLWSSMNMLRGAFNAFELPVLLLTLMAAMKAAGSHDQKLWDLFITHLAEGSFALGDLEALFKLEPKLGDVKPRSISSVRPDELLEISQAISTIPDSELAAAADYVLERHSKSQGKRGAEMGFVGSRTATLLALLASRRPKGGVVYDPACGIASTLIRAIEFGAEPEKLIGQDISAGAIYIARLRAYLHNVDIEFFQSDVLREDNLPVLRADTIVLEPPFGLRFDPALGLSDMRYVFGTPPKTSADLAWIQDAISHLSETGRAYVLTPLATLSRSGIEQTIRSGLIGSGCIEAIIALPGKMLTHTAIPLALWVLRRPSTAGAETIAFYDAAEETSPELFVPLWLDGTVDVSNSRHAHVSTSEVISSGANLLPVNWIVVDPIGQEELERNFTRSFRSVESSVEIASELLDVIRRPTSDLASRIVTVEELISQGVLTMRLGRERVSSDSDSDSGSDSDSDSEDIKCCFTHSHVRNGTLPAEVSTAENQELTSVGDVVVATINTTSALLDTTGGHLVASGLYRFTDFNAEVLLPAFFAQIISGSWNKRFQTGTAMQRANIKSLEIPLPPIEEQKRLSKIIDAAQLLEDNTKNMLANSAELRNSILLAARYGVSIEVPEGN